MKLKTLLEVIDKSEEIVIQRPYGQHDIILDPYADIYDLPENVLEATVEKVWYSPNYYRAIVVEVNV